MQRFGKLRLLLVDSSEADRQALRGLIASASDQAVVREASDVESALAALRDDGPFDCIFLDYRLPGGNAFRLLRDARQRGLDVPVVVLTTRTDTRTAVELIKSGAADYLDKATLTPERISRTVVNVVRVARAERQAGEAEDALRASERRYRLVTRATNDIIWDWDLRSDEIVWNEALRTIFGHDPARVSAHANWWYEQIHPEERDRVARGIRDTIDGGDEVWHDEYRFRRADGAYAIVLDRGYVARDAAARPVRMIGAMQDVTAQHQAQHAVREAEERLRLAVESSEIGTWDYFPTTGEVNWSARCKAIMGVPPEAEVEFGDFIRRVHPDDAPRARAAVERALDPAGRGEFELEFRTLGSDGSLHWIVSKGRVQFSGEGAARQPVRFTGTVLDVTARRRAEAERAEALASRARFYAAMSHELRTPINAVIGYNDLLLAGVYGELTPPQLGGIERSQRAARHLLNLVNDVLDISKLEAGKLEITFAPTHIAELIQDLFATVHPLAAESGSELRIVLGEGCATEPVVTDAQRVQQILLNLLSNAIKFGGGKPVEVRCDVDDAGVRVAVTDHGLGVAAEHLGRIFEEFVQLPDAGKRGTGLGLPISKRLAELLGGTIEVRSARGEGSTFTLVLPSTPPERHAPAPSALAAATEAGAA